MGLMIEDFIERIPAIKDAVEHRETFWINHKRMDDNNNKSKEISIEEIEDASERLIRFSKYLAQVFPDTKEYNGIIESSLVEIPRMREFLKENYSVNIDGTLLLKMDSHLPIAGSIKARGGIYEVLKYAEELAMKNNLLKTSDDYSIISSQKFKDFYSDYTIQVGSTGNLGLSIGIISAKLGFKVIVHMSSDAKQWKKDLLRSRGVIVKEYHTDYSEAVDKGRENSDLDPKSYFVDDENSINLFLGYSVAAERLKEQIDKAGIKVDSENPLFVYLPCGIGGAPGGIAYGLNKIFGSNVHCFFTEPTQSCCMLLGMATGLQDRVSVQDFGINGKTEADGLAVGRPSGFVGKLMDPILSGIFTIDDFRLYDLMRGLLKTEDIFIEPSACASFAGFIREDELLNYIDKNNLNGFIKNITHVAWATGGSMVPKEMREIYLNTHLNSTKPVK